MRILHFGLGSRTSADVVVTFLDGTQVTRSNVTRNQILVVDASGPPDTTLPAAPTGLTAIPVP